MDLSGDEIKTNRVFIWLEITAKARVAENNRTNIFFVRFIFEVSNILTKWDVLSDVSFNMCENGKSRMALSAVSLQM